MIKDEEAIECETFLKKKECEMCKKFVEDCIKNEGIYEFFKDKKPNLRQIDKEYIKDATCLIRGLPVCSKHFKILKKDNDRRQKMGLEITQKLDLLKYRRSDL